MDAFFPFSMAHSHGRECELDGSHDKPCLDSTKRRCRNKDDLQASACRPNMACSWQKCVHDPKSNPRRCDES